MEIQFCTQLQDGLIDLVEKFIEKSKDFERTPLSILAQISDVINRDGALWIMWENGKRVGYALAEIKATEYNSFVCLVHQIYLESDNADDICSMDGVIGDWGHQRGAIEMAFFTRRNIEAFRRILPFKWYIDSIVMKRRIPGILK